MKKKINVKILNTNEDTLLIKVPFLEVPLRVGYGFFNQRVAEGYFQLK